jgi:hypothetical protein
VFELGKNALNLFSRQVFNFWKTINVNFKIPRYIKSYNLKI